MTMPNWLLPSFIQFMPWLAMIKEKVQPKSQPIEEIEGITPKELIDALTEAWKESGLYSNEEITTRINAIRKIMYARGGIVTTDVFTSPIQINKEGETIILGEEGWDLGEIIPYFQRNWQEREVEDAQVKAKQLRGIWEEEQFQSKYRNAIEKSKFEQLQSELEWGQMERTGQTPAQTLERKSQQNYPSQGMGTGYWNQLMEGEARIGQAAQATQAREQAQMRLGELWAKQYPDWYQKYLTEAMAGWGQSRTPTGTVPQMISPETGGQAVASTGFGAEGAPTGTARVSGGTYIPEYFKPMGFAGWESPQFEQARQQAETQRYIEYPTLARGYDEWLSSNPLEPLTYTEWINKTPEALAYKQTHEAGKTTSWYDQLPKRKNEASWSAMRQYR